MNLSHTLFTTLSNKLKLKTSLLNEEKLSIKNFRIRINLLKKIKENGYKNLSIRRNRFKSENNQDLILMYIISISFLRTNTTIHVSDIKGNMRLFYSAGLVNLAGKQKRKRRIAVSKLVSLLLKKATFLYKNPVALHLNNVNFYNNFIVSKLKKTLYIRVIKNFNQAPYNGCRKKKLPRKKFTKKFK